MVFAGCLPTTQNDDCDDTSEELNSLRKVFDAFDENHDGFLTLEELFEWVKKLGLQLTREGLLKIVRSCDWDKDGRLDFNEFVALTKTLENDGKSDAEGSNGNNNNNNNHDDLTIDPNGEMREAFCVFDKDGNGLISPSELGATLRELGLIASSTSLSRIESMIRKVDTDGDGKVNFSEFETMMKGK